MDSSALFGFAGVLIGAGSSYFAQRGTEERGQRAAVRAGARLLEIDMLDIINVLERALREDSYKDQSEAELAPHWKVYEDVLAQKLLLRDWLIVRGAFARVPRIEERIRWNALWAFKTAEKTLVELTFELQDVFDKIRAARNGKHQIADLVAAARLRPSNDDQSQPLG